MNKFAVFDIDGTLIRWQLYHAIVDRLAKLGLLGEKAHQELHDARMVWKNREHSESFREYEQTLIKIYEDSLVNIDTKTFDSVAKQIAAEYKDQVYTYTRDLCKDLKGKGYRLLAISGSHQELVGYISKNYGFDYWVGTEYERLDGSFTGKKFVASHDKKTVLESLITKHSLSLTGSLAVGDSGSDIPMLEMAEIPVAFNPDRALLDKAKNQGWKIVIERKNVVYELEKENDEYILAKAN